MKLAHDTWVIIADGAKFLLLRNQGDETHLDLRVVAHEEKDTPPARELATDRAGRQHDATARTSASTAGSTAGGTGRPGTGPVQAWGKSAMEETDRHRMAEERFAAETAARLRGWAAAGRFRHLVVIADPRTLGALRGSYGNDLGPLIVAEIAKDLTNLPLDRIEAAISSFVGT